MAVPVKLVPQFNDVRVPLAEIEKSLANIKRWFIDAALSSKIAIDESWADAMEQELKSIQEHAGKARTICWDMTKVLKKKPQPKKAKTFFLNEQHTTHVTKAQARRERRKKT